MSISQQPEMLQDYHKQTHLESSVTIRVDVTGSEDGSHPTQITLTGPDGESLCNNFELTAAGYSNTFYFNEGLINDGEPFKACITLLDADSNNCVDGLNHMGRHSESVLLKAPNIVSRP